jgi:hypothetical protein
MLTIPKRPFLVVGLRRLLVLLAHLGAITLCLVLQPGSLESFVAVVFWGVSLVGVLRGFQSGKWRTTLILASLLLVHRALLGVLYAYSCLTGGRRGCL